jgi:hypothetical protein
MISSQTVRCLRTLLAAGAVSAGILSCRLGTAGDGGVSASDLRLSDEIDGWSEATGSYAEFDPDGLFGLVDGEASNHKDRGLVEGITQEMNGPGERTALIYAEDFRTKANAKSMYEFSKNTINQAVSIPRFRDSVASAERFGQSLWVYAREGQFYFKIVFDGVGYSSDPTSALNDASGFLQTLFGKL